MANIFISYAHSDKFFAELLQRMVEASEIDVWRDTKALRAGNDWRKSIDEGIEKSDLIILALSKDSSSSHYVTYEWATAMAKLKPIIPILLEECDRHPKLEPLQYLDFRHHSDASWQELVQRIREVQEATERVDEGSGSAENSGNTDRPSVEKLTDENIKARDEIKAYLNRMGLRLVSFYIIRKNINENYDDDFLRALVQKVDEFRPAQLRIKNTSKVTLDRQKTREGLKLI